MEYLTLVLRLDNSAEGSAVIRDNSAIPGASIAAMSWSHALRERDELQRQLGLATNKTPSADEQRVGPTPGAYSCVPSKKETKARLAAAAFEAARILRDEADSLRESHTINGVWDSSEIEIQAEYKRWLEIAARLTSGTDTPSEPDRQT